MECRIIGCGNLDRGDDAAGLLVARRLGAIEQSGDGLELLDSWQEHDIVILIDAVVTGSPAGTLHFWDGKNLPALDNVFRCSTHHFGIGEAVNLARALGRMPKRLLIYGIEGRQFDLGTAPSPVVIAAVERLAKQLRLECNPE